MFFAMAIVTEVGDGTRTLFWEDRWLHGQRIIDIVPYTPWWSREISRKERWQRLSTPMDFGCMRSFVVPRSLGSHHGFLAAA